MNKKGFTLIELITTFSVAAIIIVLLVNIVVSIQEVYSKSNIKTELYVNQATLSNVINSKLSDRNIYRYSSCDKSDFCYSFTLKDYSIIDLVVTNDKITFGNYVYKLDSNTEVINPTLDDIWLQSPNESYYNDIINIKIPIYSDYYPTIDFGINLIYIYNHDYMQI